MGRVIEKADAVAAARRQFLADGDVDMRRLADQLAVARATLYRVTGGRDRLLGEVLSALGSETLRRAQQEAAAATDPGIDRIIDTAARMNQAVVAFEPLIRFIRTDPQSAFLVLFTHIGGVHAASVADWTTLLRDAQARGEIDLPRDVDRLGYMLVRIGESMLFADMLAGVKPDLQLAADLQRALLELPPAPRGT